MSAQAAFERSTWREHERHLLEQDAVNAELAQLTEEETAPEGWTLEQVVAAYPSRWLDRPAVCPCCSCRAARLFQVDGDEFCANCAPLCVDCGLRASVVCDRHGNQVCAECAERAGVLETPLPTVVPGRRRFEVSAEVTTLPGGQLAICVFEDGFEIARYRGSWEGGAPDVSRAVREWAESTWDSMGLEGVA